MRRPAIFLDTNICSDVAKGVISPKEWTQVWRRIKADYRYCISYVTQSELLVKLARGSESFFSRNKCDLNVLYGRSVRRTFLAYPPAFAVEKALGVPPRLFGKEPTDFRQQIGAVLRAPSKEALLKGVRCPKSRRPPESFDLDDYQAFETRAQRGFIDVLEGYRNGAIDPPNRQRVSAQMLCDFGLTPFRAHCAKLNEALDASYRYSKFVAGLAANSNYRFQEKGRASNYQDCLQLMYLCDESMHFLTMDGDFKRRTEGGNKPRESSCTRILFSNATAR